jgi:hypothetical protein
MASRLSLLSWSGPPDDALYAAAREDHLKTPVDVQREAERMLGPKGSLGAPRS